MYIWEGTTAEELLEAERDALRARVARLEEIAVHVYNSGYHAGHNDTVECRYIDIYPSDMDSYHAEDVADLVRTLEEK